MSDLSIEAKVICGTWWGVIGNSEVVFQRPWIIHPRTRKGLDELVEKGFLTVEQQSAALVWKPTAKMHIERPAREIALTTAGFSAFMRENSFPITDESQI